MAANIAVWALYTSVSVSVATGVGVATGMIPEEWVNNVFSKFADTRQVALATPVPEQSKQPLIAEPNINVEPKDDPEVLKPIVPAFDILRLEKDGSVVVAGRAEPNSTVELVGPDGTVLGKTKSGGTGDFVILPDNPLKPGDYVLTLRSTTETGDIVISAENGILRVPENEGDEILALVTREGEASRIVVKPPTLETQSTQQPQAPKVAEETVEPKLVPAEVAKAEPEVAPEPVVETAKPKANGTEVTVAQVEPEPKAKVAPEIVTSVEEEASPEPVKTAKIEVPAPTTETTQQSSSVLVEAVEIENGKIFIAGAVKQGAVVRLYIDGKYVGTARGTSDQRFLLQRAYDLAPGTHSVRADVVEAGTGKVLARAEVPLYHQLETIVAEQKPEPKPVKPAEDKVVAEVAKREPAAKQLNAEAEVLATEPAKAVEQPEETKPVQTAEAKPEGIHTGRTIIIKPGDNLWQISRRTYGAGLRYTTIYNANRDQIRNPNRIYIGQIFKLPETEIQ